MMQQQRRLPEKHQKSHRNTPSFSSTLLDEIYQSLEQSNNHDEESTSCWDVEKWRMVEKGGSISSKPIVRRSSMILPETATDLSHSRTNPPHLNLNLSTPKPLKITHTNHHNHDQQGIYSSIKSRSSTTFKILKKMKQPISPGGKLTTFINSLFTRSRTKSKNPPPPTRSLPGEPPRFHPVTLVYDQDSRHDKSKYNNNDCKRPPFSITTLSKKGSSYHHQIQPNWRKRGQGEDEIEDRVSDSSSDLFEIDHLTLTMSDELPVYETSRHFNNKSR